LYCNSERAGVKRTIAALISITLVTDNNGYNCICYTAPLGYETGRFMISNGLQKYLTLEEDIFIGVYCTNP